MTRYTVITLLHLFTIFISFSVASQPKQIAVTSRKGTVGHVKYPASIQEFDISSSGFIDGYVAKIGSTRFLFPVGQDHVYRPFAAGADQTSGAYFKQNPQTATLPTGAPFAATLGSGIKKVSASEYWDINGSNNTAITLTWNAGSGVGALTDNTLNALTIVGWSASSKKWEKIASAVDNSAVTGGTSNLTSGSIRTSAAISPNTYSIYTLGAVASNTPAPSYAGSFESANCTEATGWVWDQNNPASQISVELMEGGTVHATAVANAYRADLKNAGTGTGQYGFSIPIPLSLKNSAARALTVRIKGTNIKLPFTRTITCSPNASAPNYAGSFESANCTDARGWVWDQNNQGSPITVELMEGGAVRATAVANVYRADLKNNNMGTGQYGFVIPMPTSLKNGVAHALTVRIKGTNIKLPFTRTVNCAPGARMAFDTTEIADLAPEETELARPAEQIDLALTISPNPTRDLVTARFFVSSQEKARLSLYNIRGQLIWQKDVAGAGQNEEQTVNLAQYPDGMYLMRLDRPAGIVTKRVMLVR